MSDQAAPVVTDMFSVILDRYEEAVYQARLFRDMAGELQMELDAATAALAVMTGQRDRAQQQLRSAQEECRKSKAPLARLHERATSLLNAVQTPGTRQAVATLDRAKNLEAALRAAAEYCSEIPF